MKNKLLLNNKTKNHIKFLPLNIEGIPHTENEQILWCQARFKELEENANSIFIKTNKKLWKKIFYLKILKEQQNLLETFIKNIEN